jgi:hypothetical protein
METTKRRQLLEAIATAPETADMARVRALELLDKLAERENAKPPERPPPIEDDAERLSRLFAMSVEFGLFDLTPEFHALVERKAEELIEQRAQKARAKFASVGAQEAAQEPEAEESSIAIDGPPEAASETEEAAEDPPTIPPEVLARQWPSKRPGSSLRDIPRSRAFRDRN